MFQFFRRKDRAVRIFLGGLLVLVCITMIAYLIPGLTGSSGSAESVLAKVDGQPITATELARQLQVLTRTQRLPANLLSVYAPQVLDQMVAEKLVLAEARRLGLNVSAEEVARELRSNPQIFPSGQYIGEEQYRSMIENRLGMTVPEFEAKLRDGMLAEKLRELVTAGASVPGQEVEREFHRRNDKARIIYALLKDADVKDSLRLSEADLTDYFNRHRSRYEMPERRKFKLVFVDTAKLKGSVTISDQDLQRFYNDNQDRFRVEDRVKVSHILFKTTGKTPEEIEAVRKKAEDVLKQVRAGEDFAKLVKGNSDDAQTTAKGGDLGWIVRGQTVPEFEKAAFSLPIGSISDLIKTVYGFHILKIEGRERARLRSLPEVAAEITPQVKAEKAARIAEDLANRAESTLKKSPNNLPAVAAQLSTPVLETDLMKRGDPLPQVGPAPAADENLFAANLKPAQLTPVITVPNGFIIALLAQISPAHAAELAEVRAQAENDLKNEKAAEITASRMKELAELARKDGDLKKAATALKMPVKESEPFTSDGSIKDVGSVFALGNNPLAMKTGDLGGPATINDIAVVFQVTEKLPASTEELAKSRDAIRKDLVDKKRSDLFDVFADTLKTRMEQQGKLKIDRAALERLTSSYER